MGNIQDRISNSKPLSQLPELKHTQETRSDSQIQITNRLTHLLSDLNTQRIISTAHKLDVNKLDWSNYVFVCVQGFPPLPNQFDMLKLPAQSIYFSAFLFSDQANGLSEKQKQQAVFKSTFKHQATNLHHLLQKIDHKKNIIFVYHSAGNFIMSMYFYYYGFQWLGNRVKGMIDISGGPLRYYISSQMLAPAIYKCDFSEIMANSDKIHKFFTGTLSKMGFDLGFKTKYHTLAFLHFIQTPEYGELFETTRKHPNVLKCIIHGRRDTLFESKLLNQKAIYFAYQRDLQEQEEKKLIKKYNQLYEIDDKNKEIKNIQERFILAIPRGQHSVHTQPRNHDLIRNAVHQYLWIIHQ